MKQITNLLFYYILLLIGLTTTSWIIWSRFLRTRTIRDIPDIFFTEYRFWILFYICCIYLYVIKNLIKPKESNIVFAELSELFFKPLVTLDHAIKYNKYIKPYYDNIIFKFVTFLDNINDKNINVYIYIFQIIPRIILVSFLLLDTFWFHKLELLYKVILIGLLPFLFRYINYSLKDIYEKWIQHLEHHYTRVVIDEKGYESLRSRIRETKAVHHCSIKSIREYIEIKYWNILENMFEEDFPYVYIGTPFAQNNVYITHYLKKTNIDITNFNDDEKREVYKSFEMKDYNKMDEMFYKYMEKILQLKGSLHTLQFLKEKQIIKYIKIIVFSLYFICWSYILIENYSYYPVEFNLFKYLIKNLTLYLRLPNDVLSGWEFYSINENQITLKNIKLILKHIWETLIQNETNN